MLTKRDSKITKRKGTRQGVHPFDAYCVVADSQGMVPQPKGERGMEKANLLVKVLPLFAAGFIATAAVIGGLSTLASTASVTVAARYTGTAIELVELIAGLVGGTAAAITLRPSKLKE